MDPGGLAGPAAHGLDGLHRVYRHVRAAVPLRAGPEDTRQARPRSVRIAAITVEAAWGPSTGSYGRKTVHMDEKAFI